MKSSLLLIFVALFCCFNLSFQQVPGGYQNLTNKQVYASKAATGALNYGAKQVANHAIANKHVANGTYTVYKLLSAQEQVVAGTNYKFHAYIHSANNATLLDSNYTVFHSLNGTNTVKQWSYRILKGYLKN